MKKILFIVLFFLMAYGITISQPLRTDTLLLNKPFYPTQILLLNQQYRYLWDKANDTLIEKTIYVPATAPPWKEGVLYYDNTYKTLTLFVDNNEVSMQIGHEMWIPVKNITGTQILNGTVVKINGAQGTMPTIEPIIAIPINGHNCPIGVATHNISHNEVGYVTTQGRVHDLNTSHYAEGSTIFLSKDTVGKFSLNLPPWPYQQIIIGTVLYSHNNNGIIYVDMRNPVGKYAPYDSLIAIFNTTGKKIPISRINTDSLKSAIMVIDTTKRVSVAGDSITFVLTEMLMPISPLKGRKSGYVVFDFISELPYGYGGSGIMLHTIIADTANNVRIEAASYDTWGTRDGNPDYSFHIEQTLYWASYTKTTKSGTGFAQDATWFMKTPGSTQQARWNIRLNTTYIYQTLMAGTLKIRYTMPQNNNSELPIKIVKGWI